MEILGKVKTLAAKSYNIYNKNLNSKEDYKNELVVTFIYNFNENGNIVHETKIDNFDEKNIYQTKKKYNNGRVLIECVNIRDGQLTDSTIYKHNEKGELIEEFRYNSDGTIGQEITYMYNDRGNCILIKSRDGNEAKSSEEHKKYDNNGSVVERIRYNPYGLKTKDEYAFKYDKNGNEVEEISDYENGSFEDKKTFIYNDMEKEIEIISYKQGKYSSKTSVKYDNIGNIVERTNYNYKGKEFKEYMRTIKQYDYDKTLNWIKSVETLNGVQTEIVDRSIVYF